MNCREIEKILPKYIEDKLSSEQNQEVLNHIDSCNNCSILHSKLIKILSLLKPTSDIQEQPFYYTRLKQKMENQKEIKVSFLHPALLKKLMQPAIYLVSLFLAVYIGILIGSGSSYQNKYSHVKEDDKDYIEIFAEYQYMNDFEIETIENILIENNGIED